MYIYFVWRNKDEYKRHRGVRGKKRERVILDNPKPKDEWKKRV